jgi:hypothetical protein
MISPVGFGTAHPFGVAPGLLPTKLGMWALPQQATRAAPCVPFAGRTSD